MEVLRFFNSKLKPSRSLSKNYQKNATPPKQTYGLYEGRQEPAFNSQEHSFSQIPNNPIQSRPKFQHTLNAPVFHRPTNAPSNYLLRQENFEPQAPSSRHPWPPHSLNRPCLNSAHNAILVDEFHHPNEIREMNERLPPGVMHNSQHSDPEAELTNRSNLRGILKNRVEIPDSNQNNHQIYSPKFDPFMPITHFEQQILFSNEDRSNLNQAAPATEHFSEVERLRKELRDKEIILNQLNAINNKNRKQKPVAVRVPSFDFNRSSFLDFITFEKNFQKMYRMRQGMSANAPKKNLHLKIEKGSSGGFLRPNNLDCQRANCLPNERFLSPRCSSSNCYASELLLHDLSMQEIAALKRLFRANSGFDRKLNYLEFLKIFALVFPQSRGYSGIVNAREAFLRADINCDGKINFYEFMYAYFYAREMHNGRIRPILHLAEPIGQCPAQFCGLKAMPSLYASPVRPPMSHAFPALSQPPPFDTCSENYDGLEHLTNFCAPNFAEPLQPIFSSSAPGNNTRNLALDDLDILDPCGVPIEKLPRLIRENNYHGYNRNNDRLVESNHQQSQIRYVKKRSSCSPR